jgi:tRNA (guanine6-N2)-methyltransferase
MQFFATTFHGLEDVAAAEISSLLPSEAHADVGKVFFSGLAEDCARVNYACKTVNRVFLLLLSEEVGGLEDIRRVSASVDYTDYIGRGQSFAVRADRVGVHPFTSLDIAASVGQAIIESFQTATGVRLKVDLSNPDVEIYALLRDSEFLLGVNTTGESLHRRFYRRGYHRAALSPTVANSMVRLSGWRHTQSLLDPFCGSGTIPLEAVVNGLNLSLGLRRGIPQMERLVFFDSDVLQKVREELYRSECVGELLNIVGLDASPKAVAVAQSSLEAMKVGPAAKFYTGNALQLEKYIRESFDKVVCNPPFGIRLGLKDPEKFYTESFTSIRRACPDASLTVLVSKPAAAYRALEGSGWTPISSRKILLGNITAHVITSL